MKFNTKMLFNVLVFLSQIPLQTVAMAPQSVAAGTLFETIKTSCSSTRENYRQLAQKLISTSDRGLMSSKNVYALKIELARSSFYETEGDDFSAYAQEVLDFLNKSGNESQSSNENCCVCFEKPQDFEIKLFCTHSFCYKCIFTWFAGNNPHREQDAHRKCPTCRQDIDVTLQKIFINDRRYLGIMIRNQHERAQEEQRLLSEFILRDLLASIEHDGAPIDVSHLTFVQLDSTTAIFFYNAQPTE